MASTKICGANHKLPLLGVELSTDKARPRGTISLRRRTGALLLGSASACTAALVLAASLGPATAQGRYYYSPYYGAPYYYPRHRAVRRDREKDTAPVSKEPFANMPKGPLLIIVSVDQQKLHFYSDGQHVEDEPVATGVTEHPTPMGVFSVIQRDRYHHSNIYSNAPMPFMERITWSGVALHEGVGLGHRASHGCIRMPHDFAARLWTLKTMGMRVIIARQDLRPAAFADAHLFVHKDKPPLAAMLPDAVKTAQSVDVAKTVDTASPAATAPDKAASDAEAATKSDRLGLRASNDIPPAPDATKASAPAANAPADATAPADAVPMPPAKPTQNTAERKTPIAIFVSRKEKKIYVRQNFEPVFDAAITIDHPERPLGTHVFTALGYLDDHSTFRWNVVSLPAELPPPAKASRRIASEERYDRYGRHWRRDDDREKPVVDLLPPQTPAEALARIAISQPVIDQISEMMVPGSSLVLSDHGLGEETGEGTDFIVVTR
jgi:lipoprotein-anchoring transpeptidase ErfK/SrfK